MQYIPYDNNWFMDVSLVVKAKVSNGENQPNRKKAVNIKQHGDKWISPSWIYFFESFCKQQHIA